MSGRAPEGTHRPTAMRVIEKLNAVFKEGDARQSSIGYIYYARGDAGRYFDYVRQAARTHSLEINRVRSSPLFAESRKDFRMLELLSSYLTPLVEPVR